MFFARILQMPSINWREIMNDSRSTLGLALRRFALFAVLPAIVWGCAFQAEAEKGQWANEEANSRSAKNSGASEAVTPVTWVAEQWWTLHHGGGVYAVCFSPDGKRVLTSGRSDGQLTVRLWDLSTGRELKSSGGNKAWDFVRDIAWSPDSRYALFAAGQYKGTQRLTLWDVENWKEVRRFEGHQNSVTRAAFSPDGRLAISGTFDGDVFVWDIQTGKEISHYKPKLGRFNGEPDGDTHRLDVTPDGKTGLWAGGTDNYQLTVFDLGTGRELTRFQPKEPSRQYIVDAVFTADGSRILAAHSYGYLRVWDVGQVSSSPALKISPEVITSVAFSQYDRLALVGSFRGELTLWNIENVQEEVPKLKRLLRLQYPHAQEKLANDRGQAAAGIMRVALSPDNRYAAAADHDGTVRIWKIYKKITPDK